MMLRLMIEPLVPWVDSRGLERSAYREIKLLSEDAQGALDWEANEFVGWRFGVVHDEWDHSEECKPLGEPGTLRYAVGHENASDFFDELVALWRHFLAWLGAGSPHALLLVADEIWSPARGWREIGPAIQEGLIEGVRGELLPTVVPGRYLIQRDRLLFDSLIQHWWPSALGMMGGFSLLPRTPLNRVNAIAHQGEIKAADLPNLHVAFSTTSVLDELGFAVLSRASSWADIREDLAHHGWSNDLPVEFALHEEP